MHGLVFFGLGLVEVELLVEDGSCLVAVLGLHPLVAGEVKALGELDIGLHLLDDPGDLVFFAEDRPVVATGVDVFAPEVVPAFVLLEGAGSLTILTTAAGYSFLILFCCALGLCRACG